MSNLKIILVNGPPRSGKDTVGSILRYHFHAKVDKFARRLKEMAHELYGLTGLKHDAYEEMKDTPLEVFHGKTPREVYIALSEHYFKPLHGEDIFGRLLWQDIQHEHGLIVVTDSGFLPEAEVLIDGAGIDNVRLLRVHREGHDFSGDSRNYIDIPQVSRTDITNNGSIKELENTVRGWMFNGAKLLPH